MSDTIFALSSGALPSGTAIVRISGPQAHHVVRKLCGTLPNDRELKLRKLVNPFNNNELDNALVVIFTAPNTFSGEDIAELHCHGGRATISAVLTCLSQFDGCRLAEAGEFSRRAFENSKLDLTELEGLSDLIAAETESQRLLALQQSTGSLRTLYEDWRSKLVQSRALIEAELDFADEDDIPGSVSDTVWSSVEELRNEIERHLDDGRMGEILHDGFRIALMGPPNAGKSSLLNALAKRDIAIVTPIAGTTRDVLEVSLDVDGLKVIVFDTAGIRETTDEIELEGIKRARRVADDSNLVIWLQPADEVCEGNIPDNAMVVLSKSDLAGSSSMETKIKISTVDPDGLKSLNSYFKDMAQEYSINHDEPLLTRHRHRESLMTSLGSLNDALNNDYSIEIKSEHLRIASEQLARIMGRIDVEDLLDVIFSEFCVGK